MGRQRESCPQERHGPCGEMAGRDGRIGDAPSGFGDMEGAQEEFVRCRGPRMVCSSLLACFEGTPVWEMGNGSAGLPDCAAAN